ncbi:carboxylesterase/lipase family protein [Sinorhizobium sp. 22678]|uniref:carboxylesterase/lipase family protein n=1 Tax=Sinorhizobium sp. 22678 TaxID=3453955 RepID=UPI003F8364FF
MTKLGRHAIVIATLFGLISAAPVWADDLSIADTSQGAFKGIAHDSYVEFLGIPYGQPPVGELRWKPPVEAVKHEGEFSVTEVASKCVQLEFKAVVGSEDCLYLNVFRPTAKSDTLLPVLFFIHGGGLMRGSADQANGAVLATENNVILVSINYRLNGFGFFAHNSTLDASGVRSANYGLLDQRLAMQWVRKNIRGFGGDPDNVTIFGYSSGAISVLAHLASPSSKTLFHKAVSLSGGWYPKGRTLAEAETSGEKDADAWGCKGDRKAVLACLRSQPIEAVVKASTPPGEYEFVPLVDDYILPMSPEDAFESGNYNKVPFITGATQHEYSRYMYGAGEKTKENFAEDAAKYLSPYSKPRIDASALAKTYDLSAYPNPTQAYAATATDFMIACQHLKMADDMVKYDRRVWAFQFGFQGNPPPPFDVPAWYGDIGNYHGVDHDYWFAKFPDSSSPDIKKLSAEMRSYLTNFARAGDPNGAGLPVWPTLADKPETVLNFAKPINPEWNVKSEHHCDFWSNYELQL